MFKTLNCVKLDPSSLKRLKFVLFLNSFKIYSRGSLTAVLSSGPLFVSSEWFGCWASVASWLSWPCLNLNKHSYSGISCPTWFRSCQFFFFKPRKSNISDWNDFPPEATGSYLSRPINPLTYFSHIYFTFSITFRYFNGQNNCISVPNSDSGCLFLCLFPACVKL